MYKRQYLLTLAVIYAVGGIGLNLLTGYAGQVSLGHAFFLGIGAYTAAVLGGTPGTHTWGLGLDLAIVLPAAALVPAVIGALVARRIVPCNRVRAFVHHRLYRFG